MYKIDNINPILSSNIFHPPSATTETIELSRIITFPTNININLFNFSINITFNQLMNQQSNQSSTNQSTNQSFNQHPTNQ